MSFLKRWGLVLATGYIFVVFSEHIFWSKVQPDDSLEGYIFTWIAYSLVAFICLSVIDFFRVKTLWSLFLVGALMGWLVEGVVVQTTYENLPLSISFTALSWHALLTVWVGWYALRRALLSSKHLIRLATFIGLGWGVWAVAAWYEDTQYIASPLEFAIFAFVVTALLMVANLCYDTLNLKAFKPTRAEVITVVLLFVVYFAFVGINLPVALLVLPLLLVVTFLGLWRNRQKETPGSVLEQFTGSIPFKNYVVLLLIPLLASGVYRLSHQFLSGASEPFLWVFYLITTPAGFIVFFWSFYKTVLSRTR
jgi:hypothetical protein